MSLLEKQANSFKSNMISASSKISGKRTAAAPNGPRAATPSADAGSSNNNPQLKRKRPDTTTVWSQPQDTGTGKEVMTQITYALNHLRAKDAPQRLDDILSYLSLHNESAKTKGVIKVILEQHEKVVYDPRGFGGRGSYAWRPPLAVRSADQLRAHLQAQTTAQGVLVKDLLEGWPAAGAEIRRLEREHRLLVVRNKKDDQARMVWADDPSLAQAVEPEFRELWHKIRLPDAEQLQEELRKANMLPTNKAAAPKVVAPVQQKKAKKPRRSGKVTNAHMTQFLRDYSKK